MQLSIKVSGGVAATLLNAKLWNVQQRCRCTAALHRFQVHLGLVGQASAAAEEARGSRAQLMGCVEA